MNQAIFEDDSNNIQPNHVSHLNDLVFFQHLT
jgi:hypothetical protein